LSYSGHSGHLISYMIIAFKYFGKENESTIVYVCVGSFVNKTHEKAILTRMEIVKQLYNACSRRISYIFVL
jgi:hypothetical protein